MLVLSLLQLPKPVAVVNDICAATPATLIALYVNDRKWEFWIAKM
jgi:hypothetical protein